MNCGDLDCADVLLNLRTRRRMRTFAFFEDRSAIASAA
jgi:hypothetical protein